MDFSEENNKKISEFLRETADLIDKNEIDDFTLEKAGEFYMCNLLRIELDKIESPVDEKDFVKFLTVGWYIYNVVLKKK